MDIFNVESEYIDSLDYLSPPVKRLPNNRNIFGRYNNESLQLYREYRNQCTKISHNHLRSKRRIKKGAVESSTSLILRKRSDRRIVDRYSTVSLSSLPTSQQYLPVKFNPTEPKCKPLIKVTVIPKSADPVETARIITRKRRKLTKRADSIVSNHENSVETTNLYLVVAGRRRDKIYEIKTTGSTTFSTETESDAPNDPIQNVKSLIQSLEMNITKKKEKDKSLFVPQMIGTALSDAQQITNPNVNVKKGNKSHVRIYGQLGLTDDDRYVLRYGATVNNKPVSDYAQLANFSTDGLLGHSESSESSVSKHKIISKNISIQARPASTIGLQPQVLREEVRDCNPLMKDVEKLSLGTQVNFNINMSCGRRLPYVSSDKDTQCFCEDNIVNFGRLYNKDKKLEFGAKACGSPLVIISVYPKPSPENMFKLDKTTRNECVSSTLRYGIHNTYTYQKQEKPHRKKLCNIEAECLSKDSKSTDKTKDCKEIRPPRSPYPKKKSSLNLQEKPVETRVVTTHTDKKSPDRYKAMRVIKNKILEKDKCNPGSSKIDNDNCTRVNKNLGTPRKSPTMRSKERGTNTDNVSSKKDLVDTYVNQSGQWSPKDSIPDKLENSKFTSAEGEYEYSNLPFDQERLNIDLKLMKNTKDMGSQKSDAKLSESLKKILAYPVKEPEAHTSMTLYCNKHYASPVERASGITIRDSLEISHRREDKNYSNCKNIQTSKIDYSDEGTKYDSDFMESSSDVVQLELSQDLMVETRGNRGKPSNPKAPIKHYTGDDCSISDPVERDKQIRELLGVDNSKLFLPKNQNSKGTTHSKSISVKTQVAGFSLVDLCKCLSGNRKKAICLAKKAYDTDDSSQCCADRSIPCCMKDANILETENPTCNRLADTFPVCLEIIQSPTACLKEKYTHQPEQICTETACAEQTFTVSNACTKQKCTTSTAQTCPSRHDEDEKYSCIGCTENNYTHAPSTELNYTNPFCFKEEQFAYPACTEQKFKFSTCTDKVYNQSICPRNKNIKPNYPHQKCLRTPITKYLQTEENYVHSLRAEQKITRKAGVGQNFAPRSLSTHRLKPQRCINIVSIASSQFQNSPNSACVSEANKFGSSHSSKIETKSQTLISIDPRRYNPCADTNKPMRTSGRPIIDLCPKPNSGKTNGSKPMPATPKNIGNNRPTSGLPKPPNLMYPPCKDSKDDMTCQKSSTMKCTCPACKPEEARNPCEKLPTRLCPPEDNQNEYNPDCLDSQGLLQNKDNQSIYQQLILNRNIQVFLQIDQFSKHRPIILSRKQYKKVKETIQNTVFKKNSRETRKKFVDASEVSVGEIRKRRNTQLCQRYDQEIQTELFGGIKNNCRRINKRNKTITKVRHYNTRAKRPKLSGDEQKCWSFSKKVQDEAQRGLRHVNRLELNAKDEYYESSSKLFNTRLDDQYKSSCATKDYRVSNDTCRKPDKSLEETPESKRRKHRNRPKLPEASARQTCTCNSSEENHEFPKVETFEQVEEDRCNNKQTLKHELHLLHAARECRKRYKDIEIIHRAPDSSYKNTHKERERLSEDKERIDECIKDMSGKDIIDLCKNQYQNPNNIYSRSGKESQKIFDPPQRGYREKICIEDHNVIEPRKDCEFQRKTREQSAELKRKCREPKVYEELRSMSKDHSFGSTNGTPDCGDVISNCQIISENYLNTDTDENNVILKTHFEHQSTTEVCSDYDKYFDGRRKIGEHQRKYCENVKRFTAECQRKRGEGQRTNKERQAETFNLQRSRERQKKQRDIREEHRISFEYDEESESGSAECRDRDKMFGENQRKLVETLKRKDRERVSERSRDQGRVYEDRREREKTNEEPRNRERVNDERRDREKVNEDWRDRDKVNKERRDREKVSEERRDRDKVNEERKDREKVNEARRDREKVNEVQRDRERVNEAHRDREKVNEEQRDRERVNEARRDREKINEEQRDRERVNEARRDREKVNEEQRDRERINDDYDRSARSGERRDRDRVSHERRDQDKVITEFVTKNRQFDIVTTEQRRVNEVQYPCREFLWKRRETQKICGDPKNRSKERERSSEKRNNINEEHKGREKVNTNIQKKRSKECQMEGRDFKLIVDRQAYDERKGQSKDHQRTSSRQITRESSEYDQQSEALTELNYVDQPQLNKDGNEANNMNPDVTPIDHDNSEILENDTNVIKEVEIRAIKPNVEVMLLETENNQASKKASSLEIHYTSVAYMKHNIDMSSSDVAVLSDSSASHVHSFHTIFRGRRNHTPPTPNLGTSVYSLYTDAGFVSDKSAEFAMVQQNSKTNKKPFLMRLMSCLVMRSTRASALKLPDTPVKDFSTVNTSVDSYHISTSLGAVEVSSSIYDTTASFYSNHTIMPINSKMKRGFINSVRGFLTNRKS